MSLRTKKIIGAALLVLIVLVGIIFSRKPSEIPPTTVGLPRQRPKNNLENRNAPKPPEMPHQLDPFATDPGRGSATPAGVPLAGVAVVVRHIRESCGRLAQIKSSPEQQQEIQNLFKDLGSTDLTLLVPAIMEFLKSGEDVVLISGIEVGPRGVEAWSSMRVALLDFLGAAMPPVAAEMARTVFEQSNSPDEWAVSLRNTAQVLPQNDPYLRAKTMELVSRKDWASNPTNGYLHAYDLIVHTGDPQFIPILERGLKEGNAAVRQASAIALERLGTTHTLTMLEALGNDNTLLANAPNLRAQFYARANVADPAQKTLVENYLQRPGLSPDELQQFAALFPNRSAALSYNLVTRTSVPNFNDLANQDLAAHGVVTQWLQDPRFAQLKTVLDPTEQRLRRFVDQATKEGMINPR